jgi:hypothetical protein
MLFTDIPLSPTHEAAAILQRDMNWNRYFILVSAIGNTLNSHKDRFDKSDLLEQSIESYSDGKIQWINLIGRDLQLMDGRTLEMKFMGGCFRGKNGRTRKCIPNIRLMNSLGTCSHSSLPPDYADFLLLSDSTTVGIVDRSTLAMYVKAKGDGLSAERVPYSSFAIVANAGHVGIPIIPFDYLESKRRMQRLFLERL